MRKTLSSKVKTRIVPRNFFINTQIYPAPFFRNGCSKMGKEFRTAGEGSAHFGDEPRPCTQERGELKERCGVYRLLDANFNRAREGLRVVEDIFRFVLPNDRIARELKKIRLDLSRTIEKMYPKLIQARDIHSDFGAKTKEKRRKNLENLVLANFSSVQEALRVLEEFGKIVSISLGDRFKKLRFRVYALEKDIFFALKDNELAE